MTAFGNKKTLPAWLCLVLAIVGMTLITGLLNLFFNLFFRIGHISYIHGNAQSLLINEASMLIGVLCTAFMLLRFGENKGMEHLGMSISGKMGDIFMGAMVAFLIMGGGFYILLQTGDIKIKGIHFNTFYFTLNLITCILIALAEEILCRGYMLGRLLRTKINRYLALVIIAAIFMAFHLANNAISTIGLVNLFLAGILLGSTYIFTKNLWFAISLHFLWNFLQGPVLGYSVSGIAPEHPIIKLKRSANIMMNGGNFGFESSLLCTGLMIVFIILIFWVMRNQEHNKQMEEMQYKEDINTAE